MTKMNFLPKFHPNSTKTAVMTIYTQLFDKINRKTHAKYKMTSITIAA